MALGSLRATTALGVLSGVAVAAFSMTTPAVAQPNSLERGRYLVETVAFCGVFLKLAERFSLSCKLPYSICGKIETTQLLPSGVQQPGVPYGSRMCVSS